MDRDLAQLTKQYRINDFKKASSDSQEVSPHKSDTGAAKSQSKVLADGAWHLSDDE
jgi:hypothetical protein